MAFAVISREEIRADFYKLASWFDLHHKTRATVLAVASVCAAAVCAAGSWKLAEATSISPAELRQVIEADKAAKSRDAEAITCRMNIQLGNGKTRIEFVTSYEPYDRRNVDMVVGLLKQAGAGTCAVFDGTAESASKAVRVLGLARRRGGAVLVSTP